MRDFLVITLVGFAVAVLGFVLLRVERRRFEDAITTTARVVKYYDYINTDSDMGIRTTMYTMAVEYMDYHGNLIHALEQSGSQRQRYPVGTEISVTYSRNKTNFFVETGSKTRYYIFYGMIVVGLFMMFGMGWVLYQNMQL